MNPSLRLIVESGPFGCPSRKSDMGNLHQRMKVARWLMGKFPSPHFRRPVRPLPQPAVQRICDELESLGLVASQDELARDEDAVTAR